MAASFELDCCSYLYELQSWQHDNRRATPVPKTKAAAALQKSLLILALYCLSAWQNPGLPMAMCFNIFHVCNVNVDNRGRLDTRVPLGSVSHACMQH